MVIGLTGQIGAGKSSAAKALAKLGAKIIDADRIGREVVEQTATLRRQLVKAFGDNILDKSGAIRRKKLAGLAFADTEATARLNALVHPVLLRELRRRVKALSRKYAIVVIDAALLLDWGLDREVDLVLVIHASRQTRLQRLAARGITRRDALAREKAQLSYQEFRRRADRLILNNGTPGELKRKIIQFYKQITSQTD